MIETAVFGGSFDPVHIEHINLCKALVRERKITRLVILPTFNPPHKKGAEASFEDRVEMAKIAFSGIAKDVIIDTLERENDGVNYISENLPKLREKYGNFYYVIGGDSLRDIMLWHDPKSIISSTNILVFNRSGCIDVTDHAKKLNEKYSGHIEMMEYIGLEVDSHTIRDRLNLGLEVDGIIPEVLNYIKEKKVYSRFESIIEKATPYYTEQRFYHAKNTALTALYYNKQCRLGLDYDKVLITAILHDVGKKCDKCGVPDGIDIPRDAVGPVQHQFVGAEIAKRDFDIDDQDILNAIRYHTTGRADMPLLERLIYTADFLSFERDYNEVYDLREITKKDFNKGFLACLQRSLDFVVENGKPLYPLTISALNFFKE